MDEKKYDVALSFAGEQRPYVEAVAEALKSRSVSVFYDKDEEVEIWGTNQVDYLQNVYQNQTRFVVMFISKEYEAKIWPQHERKSAQSRAIELLDKEYILPVRFDDTPIAGLQPTVGYISAKGKTPTELADLICKKLVSDDPAQTAVIAQSRKGSPIDLDRIKKLLAAPDAVIELHDTCMSGIRQLTSIVWSDEYPITGDCDRRSLEKRLREFEELAKSATQMMAYGLYWGKEEHSATWIEVLTMLANPPRPACHKRALEKPRSYPALLLLYAGGVGALKAGRIGELHELLDRPAIHDNWDGECQFLERLDSLCFTTLLKQEFHEGRVSDGLSMQMPIQYRAHQFLRTALSDFIPNETEFGNLFHRCEVFLTCASVEHDNGYPFQGTYMWQHSRSPEKSAFGEFASEMDRDPSLQQRVLGAGFFAGDINRWNEVREIVYAEMRKPHYW